jgi:hypothetical protein
VVVVVLVKEEPTTSEVVEGGESWNARVDDTETTSVWTAVITDDFMMFVLKCSVA